ncbi:MAG TPA: hypothetical protein VMS64_25250 [Candidatus Methylomirabilis sp.]|nr:hypothetical protein [Candidatus Methylomirabilis sp.]
MLTLLAALSPLGDALAFGLHDHVVGTDAGAPSQWSALDNRDLKPVHHCELSMSPIGLALAPEIPVLCCSAPVAPAPSMPAPFSAPPVPLGPPRA